MALKILFSQDAVLLASTASDMSSGAAAHCGTSSCESAWENVAGSGEHSCGDRIAWLQTFEGGLLSESEACGRVAGEFANVCGACMPGGESSQLWKITLALMVVALGVGVAATAAICVASVLRRRRAARLLQARNACSSAPASRSASPSQGAIDDGGNTGAQSPCRPERGSAASREMVEKMGLQLSAATGARARGIPGQMRPVRAGQHGRLADGFNSTSGGVELGRTSGGLASLDSARAANNPSPMSSPRNSGRSSSGPLARAEV